MDNEWLEILPHLAAATVAGGLIGLERSYHGRPAGFRTHTLVCLASSLLMLVTMYQGKWYAAAVQETVRIDPTRMAQGVMTGIGFLGAGVIMREGLTVRGLTTAGSIWITAAIGILCGIGFYRPVIMATLITLGVLSFFRKIENFITSQIFATHSLLFHREKAWSDAEISEMLGKNGFSAINISHNLLERGEFLECRMTIRTKDHANIERLSNHLLGSPEVVEFNIQLTRD